MSALSWVWCLVVVVVAVNIVVAYLTAICVQLAANEFQLCTLNVNFQHFSEIIVHITQAHTHTLTHSHTPADELS